MINQNQNPTHFPKTLSEVFPNGERPRVTGLRLANQVEVDGVTLAPTVKDMNWAKKNPNKLIPITNLDRRVSWMKEYNAAQKYRFERFERFCKEDGIDPKGGTHAPDMDGYPVRVN